MGNVCQVRTNDQPNFTSRDLATDPQVMIATFRNAADAIFDPILPGLEVFNGRIQQAIEHSTGLLQQELALLKLKTNTRFDRLRRAIA